MNHGRKPIPRLEYIQYLTLLSLYTCIYVCITYVSMRYIVKEVTSLLGGSVN